MRKLSAIMFTDIVGYSALMSKNENLALGILEKNRAILLESLKKFNGELIKEMGDGNLSIFQSSWDAVSCAIDIQHKISAEDSLRLRIGIHTGDIVISGHDIFGDGVNIASRIQMLCEPGEIYFSEKVYDDIRNKSELPVEKIGERNLKNISHPVTIYRIAGLKPDSGPGLANDNATVKEGPGEKGQKQSKRFKRIIWPLAMILAAALGYYLLTILVGYQKRNKTQIPVVVVSFENQTGEKSLDYLQKAIPNLIITNLEQSGMFQAMTWERMHDVLEQSGLPDTGFITADMGFDICKKEGYPFIVLGSFVKAGEVFMTDVKVLDAGTKQIVTSFSTRGNGLGSILDSQIDELSKAVSRGVGISNRQVEMATMHILDITTKSLSAYDYFLKGREAYDKMYMDDARQYLEKAVRIDPGFAIAHLYLSYAYGSLGFTQKQTEELEKAHMTSDRATEIEKLTIEAAYTGIILKDQQRQLELLKQLTEKAPKEKRVWYALGIWYRDNNYRNEALDQFMKALDLDPNYAEAINQIAYIYMNNGDFGKAIEFLKKYASLYPEDANPFDSMGDLYWKKGDLEAALVSLKHAAELKPDFYMSLTKIAYLYAMKEDYPEVNAWMNKAVKAAPTENIKKMIIWCKALLDFFYGKDKEADMLLGQTINDSESDNYLLLSMAGHWLRSYFYLDQGDYTEAMAENDRYMQLALKEPTYDSKSDSSGYFFLKGLCYVKSGSIDSAKYYYREIKAVSFDPTVDFNLNYLGNEIRIATSINPDQLDSLPSAIDRPVPMFSFPDVLLYNVPFSRNSLAEAYARLGNTGKAISEYERLIRFNPADSSRLLPNPKYHYYLGSLYQDKGLNSKAIGQYRKFLDLWQDADPESQDLIDAKNKLKWLEQASH